MDGDINFDGAIKVWLEPMNILDGAFQLLPRTSLIFPENVPPEIMTFLVHIDPEASMPTDGGSSFNGKSYCNRRVGLWFDVDVAAGYVWGSIVEKRK
jgi:hypothetical protein